MNHSVSSAGRWSLRAFIAAVSCAFGLGLVVFGFGTEGKSSKKEASPNAVAPAPQKKSAPAWNMALGNVVLVAPELGFGIKSANDGSAEQKRILSRLESQLQSLRELYRAESEKNPDLMGGMTLQFNVKPSGEVSLVKEISSRFTDADFKKAVIDEVTKWSFNDVVSDELTITCPLLFVREGMDITTLVQWEKSLGRIGEKTTLAKGNTTPIKQSKASEKTKSSEVALAGSPEKMSPAAALYQIKYATSLRKQPDFSSASLAKLAIGTKVFLLSTRADWVEVRPYDNRLSGFVRKEFVTPVELAQKQ